VATLYAKGLAHCVLAGFCIESERHEAYLITCGAPASQAAVAERIDLSAGPVFYGSGKAAADVAWSTGNYRSVLHLVRSVIHDDAVPGVGGAIQYGRAQNAPFELRGILDYIADDEQRTVRPAYSIAGTVLNHLGVGGPGDPLYVEAAVDNPFQVEWQALIDDGYEQLTRDCPDPL
jgi:hypothetical protein